MIRQQVVIHQDTRSVTVEVGTRESAIRVKFFDEDIYQAAKRSPRDRFVHEMRGDPHTIHPDFKMLYEYLADPGRVIHMTPDIAYQTIDYLKETN
ncbi:hypothetical protein HOS76_gp25 [Pseudomonas phage Henninger]|uniref:Uncharacterized protein n=1 Tax=Pseudomonas phage Henninger TaxID=2079287 RepID=A0A2K9VHE1_9CAUD|nr:hypothetical protein HOS76_gp25 [Pseudomonas phage Henninger]AUV61719.1 hypothetical protein PsPhHenninger_gp28 [Pseudomonas phage Henninger]